MRAVGSKFNHQNKFLKACLLFLLAECVQT